MARKLMCNAMRWMTLAGVIAVAGCTDLAVTEVETSASHAEPVVDAAPATPAATAHVDSAPAEEPMTSVPLGATKPFAFEPGSARESSAVECRLDGFVMPDDARVYAAGGYAGAPAGFQIDQSGHTATTMQVAVHQADAPVALLLGAYEPTVWTVGWTAGTRIVAVVVTGYHRQQVTGLPADVPVLVSTYDNRGACGYAYVGGDGSAKLNPIARQVFGRPVDVAYEARNGRVAVGTLPAGVALVTDAAAAPADQFQLKDTPLAGQAGIDAALRAGILRPATLADVQAWERAQQQAGTRDVPPVVGGSASRAPSVPYRSYTVLKAFQIPAGLYGAHSATFFVARGAPPPSGDPGHSAIQFLDTGHCEGRTCGMR
ncbi:hypothetical protein ACF3M1_01390 [Luteimonas sp. WGS1318]|uniref:hypothetical protein n=1 Tax=Luteimonas sp. WGS1318 TaxID=3366815 RepID=UPI00372D2E61